ncbi:MAG: ATP-grasp domain-containing protein [Planctomycetota bacterium]
MSSSPCRRGDVVIVGASVRGLAASAARAGHAVHAIDLFGDRDLRAVASTVLEARPYPAGLPAAVAMCPPGPVIYSGALENHPELLAAIARERCLAGCPPQAVAAVRDPEPLAVALRAAGLAFPETRSDPTGLPEDGSWIVKPRRSAGGHGIEPWHGATASQDRRDDVVWQRRVAGRPLAAAFLLAAERSRLVGASRQLVGRRWCHARPFHYCGSLDLDPATLALAVREQLDRLGGLLGERFGLVGLVGVDIVVDRDGRLHVIEVNPRPTASMELVERATGLSLATAQLAACGLAPPPAAPRPRDGAWSKAILFARHDTAIDEARIAALEALAGPPREGWPMLADIPRPPQVIPAGRPICTLFAHAPTPRASLARLRRLTRAAAAALGGGLSPPSDARPGAGRPGTA